MVDGGDMSDDWMVREGWLKREDAITSRTYQIAPSRVDSDNVLLLPQGGAPEGGAPSYDDDDTAERQLDYDADLLAGTPDEIEHYVYNTPDAAVQMLRHLLR